MPLDMCVGRLSQGIPVKKNFLRLYSKQLVSVEQQNGHVRLIVHGYHSVYGFIRTASIHMNISPLNNERTRISGKIYTHVLNYIFIFYWFILPIMFVSLILENKPESFCISAFLMASILIFWGRKQHFKEAVQNRLIDTLQP